MYEIDNLAFGTNIGEREIKDEIQILRKEETDPFLFDQVPKKAQWEEIIKLCEKYLRNSKDLYILNRMCEAMTALYGIEGFRISIDIIHEFFQDPLDFFPKEKDTRESYLHWINNRLWKYLYKNIRVEEILYRGKELTDIETNLLQECVKKAKSLFFYSENFEKNVSLLISDLQKN